MRRHRRGLRSCLLGWMSRLTAQGSALVCTPDETCGPRCVVWEVIGRVCACLDCGSKCIRSATTVLCGSADPPPDRRKVGQGARLLSTDRAVGRRAAGPGVGDIARGETGRGYAHTGNNKYLFSKILPLTDTLLWRWTRAPASARSDDGAEPAPGRHPAPALSLPRTLTGHTLCRLSCIYDARVCGHVAETRLAR